MKKSIISAMLLMFWLIPAIDAKAAKGKDGSVCQILDVPLEPVVQLSGAFVALSDVSGHGDVSLAEFEAHWSFAHFWDILFGDVDLAFRLSSTVFSDSGGIDLPSELSMFALDAGWTARFRDGYSLQARITPGIYNDFREFSMEALYMPVSVAVIKTLDSKRAAIFGAQIRTGFEQQIMPLIGIAWMLNDRMRLDARLPDSRFACYLGRGWSAHAGFSWNNMSYSLHENVFGADQVTVKDLRLFLGATFRPSDNLQLSGEVGRVMGRNIEYDNTVPGAESDFDLRPATFVRFVLGGPF